MGVSLLRYWGGYLKSLRAARRIANDLRLAAEKGWSTYLVCCQAPEDEGWLEPIREIGTNIEYLPRAKSNVDWKCIVRTYELCRRLRCKVFHCDNIHTSPLIGAAAAGVPVRLWSKRAMEPAYEAGRRRTLRDRAALTVRLSCLLATRTLAVSRAVRDELVELGVPAARLLVLRDAIDGATAASVGREASRATFGYTNSELVITTIGHAVPVKGWDILLRSLAAIANAVPEARGLFVGSTSAERERPYFEGVIGYVEAHGLVGRAQFTGHLPEIGGALAASDIFVLPSRSEGLPFALLEALGAGVPCVVTRVGGVSELIRNGINGLLVEREDAEGLSRALLLLARDPSLRLRLGEGAKTLRVAPKMEEYGGQLFGLYESLLMERSPRNGVTGG